VFALEKGKLVFLDIIKEKRGRSDMKGTKMYKSYHFIPQNCINICKIFLHPLNVPRAASLYRPGGIHMSEYSIKIWEHIFLAERNHLMCKERLLVKEFRGTHLGRTPLQ